MLGVQIVSDPTATFLSRKLLIVNSSSRSKSDNEIIL